MLRMLAQGDQENFAQFAADNVRFSKHLVGYGLITQSNHGFSFNIEALREYLVNVHQYERLNLSNEEKISEISCRRNHIEKLIRVVVRNALRSKYGRLKACEIVLLAIPENRRKKLENNDLDCLLSRDSSPLFFLELISIIKREWEIFVNIFEMEKVKVEIILKEINDVGRPDAHAKSIDEDEFSQLRLHFKKLESILKDWGS